MIIQTIFRYFLYSFEIKIKEIDGKCQEKKSRT